MFLFLCSKDENANFGISVRMWKTRFKNNAFGSEFSSVEFSSVEPGTVAQECYSSQNADEK